MFLAYPLAISAFEAKHSFIKIFKHKYPDIEERQIGLVKAEIEKTHETVMVWVIALQLLIYMYYTDITLKSS